MIVNPLRGEAQVKIEGEALRLVFDNSAFLALEDLTNRAFLDVTAELLDAETGGRPAKLGTMQALLWAATREHHPDLTATHCGDLFLANSRILRPVVMQALFAALPKKKAPAKPGEVKATTKPGRTPRKPPKKKPAGTGTKN